MKKPGTNDNFFKTYDDGFVKIYPYKSAVVVEKYKETEISGTQQQDICDHISSQYGLSRVGIVLKTVSYSMSMDAMLCLRQFMTTYKGPFAYVIPTFDKEKRSATNYSSSTYLKGKDVRTFSSLEVAYEVLNVTE
ncbi:hypothetical protein [Pleionea sediminis]|uniref:hypothetical protein n=1 Tax=Pleionea sediminis TaxID=2569479 RepID=UPI0011861DFD|nr:hypothetical protein [Pleionea sediminis]